MSSGTDTRETRDLASEIKFVVDPATAQRIREWTRARFAPDPYGWGLFGDEYRTTTLYFDTAELDVFHRRGSFGRSKYRARRYGAGDVVFLERKLRNSSLLAKRRTLIPLDDLEYLDDQLISGWAGHWFHRRLLARRLMPMTQFSYHRTARIAMTAEGPARITLDDQFHVAPTTGLFFHGELGVPALDEQVIVEMKYRRSMPAVLKHVVEEFRLSPQRVSKYRLGVEALGHREPQAAASPAETQPICA